MTPTVESIAEMSVLPYVDVLLWIVAVVFVGGVLAHRRENLEWARRITAGGWDCSGSFGSCSASTSR